MHVVLSLPMPISLAYGKQYAPSLLLYELELTPENIELVLRHMEINILDALGEKGKGARIAWSVSPGGYITRDAREKILDISDVLFLSGVETAALFTGTAEDVAPQIARVMDIFQERQHWVRAIHVDAAPVPHECARDRVSIMLDLARGLQVPYLARAKFVIEPREFPHELPITVRPE